MTTFPELEAALDAAAHRHSASVGDRPGARSCRPSRSRASWRWSCSCGPTRAPRARRRSARRLQASRRRPWRSSHALTLAPATRPLRPGRRPARATRRTARGRRRIRAPDPVPAEWARHVRLGGDPGRSARHGQHQLPQRHPGTRRVPRRVPLDAGTGWPARVCPRSGARPRPCSPTSPRGLRSAARPSARRELADQAAAGDAAAVSGVRRPATARSCSSAASGHESRRPCRSPTTYGGSLPGGR